MAGVDVLPVEIILQILSRLPVKSLLRFTCVSKQWRFVIKSDLEFAKSQFKRASEHKTLTRRLLCTGLSPEQFVSLDLKMPASSFGDKSLYRKVNFPFLQQGGKVKQLGSCNGLVFLVLEDESRIKFYVCNPSTGFFKQLPSPVSDEEDVVTYRIGVGYVSATDDYKVLVGYLEKDPGEDSGVVEAIQIFSLRAHCWKRIEEPGGTGGVYVSPSMALCNETLHWLSFERDQLFAFDLAKEELRTMPLPNFSQDGMNFGDIGVSHEGCLCVLRHCLRPCDSIDFWVMREYGVRDTWTKQFRLFNLMLSDPLDKPWKLIRFLVTENSTFGWTDYTLARIDHKEEEKHGLYVVRGYPICITDYEESLVWINE